MNKAIPVEAVTMTTPRIDPRFKLGLALAWLVAALVLGVVLITDGLYNPQNFTITRITLTGDAPHVDREGLRQSVVEMIDGNYFSLDTDQIVLALGKLPWVEKVRLRRRWPDTLMINIEEHQPIAVWGDDKWLTTTGKLVSLPLPENVALPQLNGPLERAEEMWSRYRSWSSLFAGNGMRLSSMELSRQHLYTLGLEYTSRSAGTARGFTMILSQSNADQQLKAFLESRRQSLIDYPGMITTVDLRYPSGFSVSHYEPE